MSSGQIETTAINSVEVGTSLAPLAVQETGGALKVHTDTPHLVSLGGGRLSTAVTLHPLPSGRVTVGSGNNVDIPVHGTGVESIHCHIENVNGVVTLYPVSQTITIDGLNVVSPTRLAQGVIITIGRSNYMRFNHPAEAKLMKSVLPNQRISMGPIQFYPTNNSSPTNNSTNNDTTNSKKPPVAPKKSPRESWESSIPPEENTILSKVSKFELFASQHIKKSQLSPKVFPADLVTVNTPAKDVLGRNAPTNLHNLTKNLQNSAVNYTENTTYEKLNPKSVQIHENGCIPKLKNNTYANVTINNSSSSTPRYDDETSSIMSQSMYNMPSNNCFTTMQQRNVYGSNPNLTDNTKSQLNNSIYNNNHNHNNNIKLTTPSPSFNRNPSYRNVTPITSTKHFNDDVANDMLAKRKSGSLSELSKVIIRDNNTIVNIPTNSIEDLTQTQRIGHDSGHEFNKSNHQSHHNERVRDQEIEKAEHARLEEILNMCAEYEKQAQCERITTKSVPTPNRIKTNGSLPRDKRSSPTVQQLNDEPVFKFDFDSSSTPTTSSPINHYHQQYQNKTNWCARNNLNTYENVSINKFPSPTLTDNNHHTPKYENVDIQKVHPSPYENVTLQHQQMNYHPQSPRTRIKTYVTANKSDTNNGYNKPENNSYKEDYDYLEQFINNTKTIFNDSFNRKQTTSGGNNTNNLQQTPDSSPVITKSPQQHPNSSTPNGISKVLTDRFMNENLLHEMSNYKTTMNGCNDTNDRKTPINTDPIDTVLKEKNNNEMMSAGSEVNSLSRKNKKEIMTTVITEEKNKCIEKLTMERNKIQNAISNVKSKIADIENQEEELIRELELEKSLISGEYRSEMSALKELEKGKAALMERIEQMEQEIENSKIIQERQQNDTKIKLKEAQDNVARLQNDLSNCDKSSPEYVNIQLTLTKSQDMLENERKCFEDLEFHHLEHEANLLATREELQREIQDITQQIDKRTKQIQELDAQKVEAFDHTTYESKELERNLLTCLRNLEEYRNRLRSIDTELESLTGQKLDYYSDNELLSDEDSADSIKSQLKNKLENIKLLKNQLSNMEKENMRRDSSSIDKKQQKIKSSQEHKQHQSPTTPTTVTTPSSTATYQVNGINSENSSSYSKQIDIMSQSFHEMFLNDKSSPDTRLFKPQQQQNSSQLLSMSFHENFLKFGHLSPEGKTPSQDDIDRISKVTSDAPMDLGENTASLGRKTIESLKEIERVRQIHLIQQGSHVIEEERKRVSELKRRVQNEVRAEWEERRQRECNSLNSVGSEESAVTSSEGNSGITRESVAESEEAEEKPKHSVTFNTTPIQHESSQRRNSQIDKGDLSDYDRRPLSESSDVSYETQLSVKPRPRSLSSPQQRPLTRYLPIRSDNLNLKQHIESAGHQVDLCPHVILDSTTCRGYLNKMGSRFHSWNKRWFVFDRVKRIFVYFPDRHEKKRRGGAYFQAIEEVYLDHLNTVKSPNPQLTFIVKTHERTYHLMAPSPEAMRIWIDVIFTGAEGYQEFEHGT
ncbi:pleckstrin homology-like domain family B member 1 [Chrysoperla carnea]|uniref:pleckstrin homology-like domain family B member 1 n=1 Tax=Chrysoperla carnea TaxID=189513 RepID=UPI001D08AEF7|nr:pleckstrin homology-like domain family B member 1 [Chrysoperla carnea]